MVRTRFSDRYAESRIGMHQGSTGVFRSGLLGSEGKLFRTPEGRDDDILPTLKGGVSFFGMSKTHKSFLY
ncbi:hypothetical protein HY988_05915 [Candidatus Micrarchaeota archaeon]|nr:hypothetical protein [Candidatus Micrarchaeota archaeon]